MTSFDQGYSDQAAGMLNEALADADTPQGRAYRDGARAQRRDVEDGTTREERAARAAAEPAPETEPPAPAPAAVPDPVSIGAAFSEPEPAARRPRKAKPVDDAQASLF